MQPKVMTSPIAKFNSLSQRYTDGSEIGRPSLCEAVPFRDSFAQVRNGKMQGRSGARPVESRPERPISTSSLHAIWALRLSFRPGRPRAAAADDRLERRQHE